MEFTYDSSERKILFVDLKVKFNEGKISTDIHIKSKSRHQYLHFTSSHPNHTKWLIVYGHGLRFERRSS